MRDAAGTMDDAWELEAGIVRPYLFTRGRTEPAMPPPAVEALLGTTAAGHRALPRLPTERRRIVELCHRPTSVAEVSAHLGVPLGIVRVVVADLYADGLVTVHAGLRDDGIDDVHHEVAVLRRLIDHIRALPA